MASDKRTVNMTLPPHIVEILDRTGNRSGYIEHLVEQRGARFQGALRFLREWSTADPEGRAVTLTPKMVKAVSAALLGTYIDVSWWGQQGAQYLGAELADAEALNGHCAQWELDRRDWHALIVALFAGDNSAAMLGEALRAVNDECWTHSDDYDRQLEPW